MRIPILILTCMVSLAACSSRPPIQTIADVDNGQVFSQRDVSEFVNLREKCASHPWAVSTASRNQLEQKKPTEYDLGGL